MNLNGLDTHFQKPRPVDQIRGPRLSDGKSERADGGKSARRILWSGPDERGEIAGEPRRAVQRQRVCADEKELNAVPLNDPMNSSKSGARSMELPPGELDRGDALLGRSRQPVLKRASGAPLFIECRQAYDAL
jgi:hypothetical protein